MNSFQAITFLIEVSTLSIRALEDPILSLGMLLKVPAIVIKTLECY